MNKRRIRHNECLFGAGASAIFVGFTTLLVYFAVWSPSVTSQSPLASELQRDAILHVEDNILNFFNQSKAQASALGFAVSRELAGKPDSWDSLQPIQSILWGTLRGTPGLASVVYQSTSNLSVSYYRPDSPMSEISRESSDANDLHQYAVDDLGFRTSDPPVSVTRVPFYDRSWYYLAAATPPNATVSSTVGLFGLPLIFFSIGVINATSLRGVVGMAYPVQELQNFVERLNTVATVYLLTGGSIRLIASIPGSPSNFSDATASENPVVADSARKLQPLLEDSSDYEGMIQLDGASYFYGIRKLLTDYNTTIVALVPRKHFFGQIDKSRRITIAIFVTAIALWLLFAALVGVMLYRLRKREKASLGRAEHEEKLRKEKQTMMARLSHELRTPMSAMIGLLEVIQSECLSQEQKGQISLLQKTSDDLMKLCDGLLMMAKTDAGKSNVEENVFNLRKEMESALNSIVPLTAPRGIQLSLEYGSDLVEEFLGDRRKLRQVIDNLLNNAAKFTDSGSIRIRVSKGRFVPPHVQFVDVRVEDTGCGIPEDKMEDIFHEFVQGSQAVKTLLGGSGLGLSIVRSLCKLMGGDVEIESSSPSGTCFHYWVKLKTVTSFRKAETVIQTYEAPNSLAGMHILVAEDTRLLAKLIERMLTKQGAEVTLAADGVEVVEAYEANPVRYSAILMDLQMPRMDGYDATRKIRALEAGGGVPGSVPIIALTAHAMDSDAEKCKQVGMNDYLRKPLDVKIIVATLLRRCRGPNSPRTPEAR